MSSSRSQSKRPRAAPRAPPNPSHEGIVFVGEQQTTKFDKFWSRTYEPTRFVTDDALDELFMTEQIHRLFRNIGWEGLLEKRRQSYKRLTVEFLSSVYLADGGIHFRSMNENCDFTYDELCGMIDAPTANTFSPGDQLVGYNAARFWQQITRQRIYMPKASKNSHIIHPVLRVAHRILAALMFPRSETSTVNSAELQLLWCMTQNFEAKPHFGSFLARRLSSISPEKKKGSICVGGWVTLLADYAGVDVEELWDPATPTVPVITFDTFASMKLFRKKRTGTHWVVFHTYFILTAENRHLLILADPTSATDWQLSEITGPAPELDEPMPDPPQPHQPPQGDYPPYHQTYLDHFTSLDNQYADIREELDFVTTASAEHMSLLDDFRTEQGERWREQEQHNRNMHYLMSDMHRALVLPPQQQPPQAPHWPQYYPSDYQPSYPTSQYPPPYPQYPHYPSGPSGPSSSSGPQ